MEDKKELLRRIFGYAEFRRGQEEIVDALLAGRDALCVMPTGAGKSVCYQIPALMLPGITIVVSPLISLMKDQVDALRQNGVAAAYLNSTLPPEEFMQTMMDLNEGKFKLIYVAPERLLADGFRAICSRLEVSLLAVDEAHCVSQWGQDFRPDYLLIPDFVALLKKRPAIGAFTATATQSVRGDIIDLLGLRSPQMTVTGFDRPNLYFAVEKPNSRPLALLKKIEERPGKSGIVYCATRRTVEETEVLLREKGIAATRYHAGLSEEERRQNQDDFLYDRKTVMVATNAFGMGIDKSNVSYVIHYNMPKNLESYYQEAGRAGRDGSPAECILFYSRKDIQTNLWLIENSEPNQNLEPDLQEALVQRDIRRLQQMEFYCMTTECLRAYILRYFGEKAGEHCGNCSSCASGTQLTDATVQAQQALSCVVRCGQLFGAKMIADVLRGAQNDRIRELGFDQLSTYGLMKDRAAAEIRQLLDALRLQGYLRTTEDGYQVLKVTPAARAILFEGKKFEMRVISAPMWANVDGEADPKLFEKLKKLRSKLAIRSGVPAYVVFTDAALRDMCLKKPVTEQQLLQVTGVGEQKVKRYGQKFMETIRAHLEEK